MRREKKEEVFFCCMLSAGVMARIASGGRTYSIKEELENCIEGVRWS